MRVVFIGDVFCDTPSALSRWPRELNGDVCVFNFEYVYDNGVLSSLDAAEGKVNLKGNGNPFLPGFNRYVACLANNHALDYTDNGVASTLEFIGDRGEPIGLVHGGDGALAPFVSIGGGGLCRRICKDIW